MTAPAHNAVPDPIEAWEVRTPDGASIFVRRHGNPDGAALLVSHGNGFAVDAYYPFWSRLADRFDIFVHDQRNHGWNPVSDRMLHNIPQFAEDTERVLRSIGLRLKSAKPIIGISHSVSSMVALRHAANGGEYSALVLFDPPICSPGGLPEDIQRGGALLSAVTLKRKHKIRVPGRTCSIPVPKPPVRAGEPWGPSTCWPGPVSAPRPTGWVTNSAARANTKPRSSSFSSSGR